MSGRHLVLPGLLFAASAALGFLFYEARQDVSAVAVRHGEPENPAAVTRPVFSLSDIDGNERSITEWDGKALIVNFWATWCPPCRREIPVLNGIQREFADRDIQVIGVAIDDPRAVSQFARETVFDYPILVGEQEGVEAAEAFGADVVALPITAFTDHAGSVIEVHAGEITRREIEAILRRLPR